MFQSLNVRHKKSFVYFYSLITGIPNSPHVCVCVSAFHNLTFCIFFLSLQFPGFITLYGKHKKFNNTKPYGCEPNTL